MGGRIMIDIIQLILLIILVDRSLFIHSYYKIAIEHEKKQETSLGHVGGWVAIWICRKPPQEEKYWRYKRIFFFDYVDKKFK